MEVTKVRFKILVLGEVGVGKTLFEAYIGKTNSLSGNHRSGGDYSRYRSTTGASFSVLDMDVAIARVKLLFWVMSGHLGFDHVHRAILSNSKAAILLYDITNASSMNWLAEWPYQISEYCGEIPMVLAGNKVDIIENREISRDEGLTFQREHNLTSFREISMKSGEGVFEMLEYLRDMLFSIFNSLKKSKKKILI